MEVMARSGISMRYRCCDHVAPPSRLRKMPPPVVPTNINLGSDGATSIAEIGDPSNVRDTGIQRRPLLLVRHNRLDPAHSFLTPLAAEGSMVKTVKAR